MIVLMINKGFTILELMITIAIMAILIAVAVPSFNSMMISNSVTRDQDTIFSLLLTARSEAVKRGRAVSVCQSSNLTACDSSASWTDGVIVFFDSNADGDIDTDTNPATIDDVVLRVNEKLQSNVNLAFTGGDHVTFNSLGQAEGNVGTFTFTHSNGTDYTRTMTLSATGRVRK
ncbi:GspH/FimT family pseudopilin [Psychromonas sp. KJ10-10]|uniref:GspH/FimT family pseudopilin n=1 Tax=Psychromonas sp. KJ10-10 TaxID=3391823 RepID=UPI0039B6586C